MAGAAQQRSARQLRTEVAIRHLAAIACPDPGISRISVCALA
jgi:hypothetical protein